jgi:2-(1,2-epoxy-1,2-dihydrophenyl)acetyl-CoA isomerase
VEPLVKEALDEGVLTLTLNRPDALNALNPELMEDLLQALERAAADPAARCVVLTGAGRGFCAGGDLSAGAGAAEAGAQDLLARIDGLQRAAQASVLLHTMPKTTIAMINGPCAGSGLSLAGACDLRVASETAVFVSAFARVGLPGDYGGAWFWTRILGTAKARELYLLSDKLDAAAALQIGLVSRVAPAADLTATTLAIARRLAESGGPGQACAKANLNAAETCELADLLERESRATMLIQDSLVRAAAQASKSG